MKNSEFRKLDRSAQLATIKAGRYHRSFRIDRDGVDEDTRSVWLSIASEAPYQRYWGTEVLEISAKAIRDERLKNGAPLLVAHDTSDQVGIIEEYRIGLDNRLRVRARFGKSDRAEEIWQDVLDGIRVSASVGYIIHDLVLQEKTDDEAIYRVTDWEPFEGSLVSVPADPSVGVGRSTEINSTQGEDNMDEGNRRDDDARGDDEHQRLSRRERKQARHDGGQHDEGYRRREGFATGELDRIRRVIAAGESFARFGGVEAANRIIKDPRYVGDYEGSMDAVRAAVRDHIDRHPQGGTATGGDLQAAAYGTGARVRYNYGHLKSFKDMQWDSGQAMKAEEAAYRAGVWFAAAVGQKPWAQRRAQELALPMLYRDSDGQVHDLAGHDISVRAANENVLSAGGALVPIEMENAIIALRDQYGVARRVARPRTMNTDTLKIPRRKSGVTAYFFQDDDGVGITESQMGWDNVTLSTKKLGALAKVSRDLMEDAVISIVDILAYEMAYAFAVKEDQCYFSGDGTSTYGGIQGILTKMNGSAYVSRVTAATGHNTFGNVDNTDITSMMAGVAQYADTPQAVFVTSHYGYQALFNRLKVTAGGNRLDIMGEKPTPQYLGYEVITSEAMPKVSSSLSGQTMFLFGRFDLGTSLGTRRGIEVLTLVERYAELGQIGLIATERFDVVVHDLGTTSTSDVNGGKGPISGLYGN